MEKLQKSCLILGITEGASPGEIKSAYRRKVKTWHPDLFRDDPKLRRTAEEKIKEINEARRTLFFYAQNGEAAQRQAKTPTENAAHRHDYSRGTTAPGQDASTLMRCPACGRMNSLSTDRLSRLFLCYNCRTPLWQFAGARILPLTPPAKGFRIGRTVFVLPTLDYVKFLIFCTCSICIFILAGIGTMIILGAATDTAVRLLGKYFP